MSIPGTLLGSAHWDALVPFEPRHWAELRSRNRCAEATAACDDGLAVVLAMSATAKAVLVDGRVECIVGLMLTPNDGHPWVMAPDPNIARFARAVRLCEPFIRECHQHRQVLCVERNEFDSATRLWLGGLGFKLTAFDPDGLSERWELKASGDAVSAVRDGG